MLSRGSDVRLGVGLSVIYRGMGGDQFRVAAPCALAVLWPPLAVSPLASFSLEDANALAHSTCLPCVRDKTGLEAPTVESCVLNFTAVSLRTIRFNL